MYKRTDKKKSKVKNKFRAKGKFPILGRKKTGRRTPNNINVDHDQEPKVIKLVTEPRSVADVGSADPTWKSANANTLDIPASTRSLRPRAPRGEVISGK